mmetsp:Transcript_48825/g.157636  ORF Transcript_48825/g.157636 Transcript_48825/m.157636 type:complete len:142 (+) Transcript_48825:906-1331(+)
MMCAEWRGVQRPAAIQAQTLQRERSWWTLGPNSCAEGWRAVLRDPAECKRADPTVGLSTMTKDGQHNEGIQRNENDQVDNGIVADKAAPEVQMGAAMRAQRSRGDARQSAHQDRPDGRHDGEKVDMKVDTMAPPAESSRWT